MKGKKTGGRQAGTPNRTSTQIKEVLSSLCSRYMGEATKGEDGIRLTDFERDLRALNPAERVKAYSGLLSYIAPKQQAISVSEQAQIEEEALTRWLSTAPEEAITAISEKILSLQQAHRQQTQAQA